MPHHRRLRLSLALLVVGIAGVSGCESENYAACQGFREDFAALTCAAGLDPGVDCNAYQDFPCPTQDYFDCLSDGHTCNEAGDLAVDVSGCNLLLDCSQ